VNGSSGSHLPRLRRTSKKIEPDIRGANADPGAAAINSRPRQRVRVVTSSWILRGLRWERLMSSGAGAPFTELQIPRRPKCSFLNRKSPYRRDSLWRKGTTSPTAATSETSTSIKSYYCPNRTYWPQSPTKLITYATGAPVQFADRPLVEQIVKDSRAHGFGLRTMVHQVVESRVFRKSESP